MRIIISPAKKMNADTDTLEPAHLPVFLEDTEEIMRWMQSLSFSEAKNLWGCNEKIAGLNFKRFEEMELRRGLTPALLSYEGIQYQYMAPAVFEEGQYKKGTYAKMARGEMVRFMAENKIEDPEEIKEFRRLNYVFCEKLSSKDEYVFIRQGG